MSQKSVKKSVPKSGWKWLYRYSQVQPCTGRCSHCDIRNATAISDSFSSSPAARVGFHITRHLNRMRDHIRTALSLIRRGGILRPYFGKARHLITFLGFLSNPFQSPNLQGQTVSGSQKQNLEKTFIWLSSENPKECLGRCVCLACSRRRCKGFHSTHTITPGMINTT